MNTITLFRNEALEIVCEPMGMYPEHLTVYRASGIGRHREILTGPTSLAAWLAAQAEAKLIDLSVPANEAADRIVGAAANERRKFVREQSRLDAIERSDRRVTVEVKQDETNVWWVALVTYTATGRSVSRAADEGGTHSQAWLAEAEGMARAERAAAGAAITVKS